MPVTSMETGGGVEDDKKLNKYALGCCAVASIINIIFGYDTGVMSGALMFIEHDLKITHQEEEILAGILNFCALIGSLIAGRTSDYMGRRYTLVTAAIIFLLGSVLMGWAPNYPILLSGRCVAGIGVGFALMIAPNYTAEISSATHRGFLSSLPEVCIALGILLGYVSNFLFGKLSNTRLGWRLMLGLAAIPSLFLGIGLLWMPESPRWLVLKGQLREARNVLGKVSNSEAEAESRFDAIKKAAGYPDDYDVNSDVVERPPPQQQGGGGGEIALWKEMFSRNVRRVTVAALGIHFFEHAVGIEAVMIYGPRIFKKAGIKGREKLLLANMGIGLTKFIFIVLSTFLLDRVGRRPLLLTSTAGAAAALAVLGWALKTQEGKSAAKWVLTTCIVTTYTYVAFFNSGVAPLTWVYSAEIWPLRLRAIGAGVGVAVNRLMNATVSMTFISLYSTITIGGAFFLFCGIAVVAWVFFYFCLPETKGKTLEEIEEIFNKRGAAGSRGIGGEGETELQQPVR